MPTDNDIHIALFAAAPNPKPQQSLSVTRAFHTYAFEKIVKQIKDPNPELQLKSVRCCREFLSLPEQQQQCIKAGIVDVLKEALISKDDNMCCEAAFALQMIATRALGCQALIDSGALEQLAVLLGSNSPRVRKAAYKTLVEGSHSHVMRSWLQGSFIPETGNIQHYVMGLSGLAFLEKLVDYAVDESEEDCSSMALQLLRSSLISLKAESVTLHLIEKTGVIEKCSTILEKSESPAVLEAASDLLSLLCVCNEGREVILELGTVTSIIGKLFLMLENDEEGAIVALMASLMTITVDELCKQQMYEVDGVTVLLETLKNRSAKDMTSKVVLNTLQCISNMAEHPQARQKLCEGGVQENLEAILAKADEEGKPVLKTIAERTLKYVQFSHLPRRT